MNLQHFTEEVAWPVEAGLPAGTLAAHHAQHASFTAQVMQFADGWTGDQQGARRIGFCVASRLRWRPASWR